MAAVVGDEGTSATQRSGRDRALAVLMRALEPLAICEPQRCSVLQRLHGTFRWSPVGSTAADAIR
jgi:hypothetical protein